MLKKYTINQSYGYRIIMESQNDSVKSISIIVREIPILKNHHLDFSVYLTLNVVSVTPGMTVKYTLLRNSVSGYNILKIVGTGDE